MAKKPKSEKPTTDTKAFNEHLENLIQQADAQTAASITRGCRRWRLLRRGDEGGWGSEARWPEVRRVRASRIVPLGPEQRSLGITKL